MEATNPEQQSEQQPEQESEQQSEQQSEQVRKTVRISPTNSPNNFPPEQLRIVSQLLRGWENSQTQCVWIWCVVGGPTFDDVVRTQRWRWSICGSVGISQAPAVAKGTGNTFGSMVHPAQLHIYMKLIPPFVPTTKDDE